MVLHVNPCKTDINSVCCVCLRFRPGVRFAVVTSLAGLSAARGRDGAGGGQRRPFLFIFPSFLPKNTLIIPETHRTGFPRPESTVTGGIAAKGLAASAGKFLTGARDSGGNLARLRDLTRRGFVADNGEITSKYCRSLCVTLNINRVKVRAGEPQRPRR